MKKKDYYSVLGVSKTASQDEINKAYRKLAIRYHPDTSTETNAEERFKEIEEAYSTLGNESKREDYDYSGKRKKHTSYSSHDFNPASVDDYFFNFYHEFGKKYVDADIHYNLHVTLKESVLGCKKEIKVDRMKFCEVCSGSGNSIDKNCSICGGKGTKVKKDNYRVFLSTCDCNTTCNACKGKGSVVFDTKQVVLKIKPEFGTNIIKLTSLGNHFNDVVGNVMVHLCVNDHPYFSRNRLDLICRLPITYTQLILGDKIKISNFVEDFEVDIPPTNSLEGVVILKNKGVYSSTGQKGDLLVRYYLKIDKKYSEKYKKVLQDLKGCDTNNELDLFKKSMN